MGVFLKCSSRRRTTTTNIWYTSNFSKESSSTFQGQIKIRQSRLLASVDYDRFRSNLWLFTCACNWFIFNFDLLLPQEFSKSCQTPPLFPVKCLLPNVKHPCSDWGGEKTNKTACNDSAVGLTEPQASLGAIVTGRALSLHLGGGRREC